jgi:hypothetical protein
VRTLAIHVAWFDRVTAMRMAGWFHTNVDAFAGLRARPLAACQCKGDSGFDLAVRQERRFTVLRMTFAASCVLVVSGLYGCGPGAPAVKTVPVTGTVTYKGNPVEGAIVSFLSAADGRPAGGQTDSQGKFSLKTNLSGSKSVDGAVEGNYTITVSSATSAPRPFGTPGAGTDPSGVSPDQMDAMRKKMQSQHGSAPGSEDPSSEREQVLAQSKSTLPAKYADLATSPFKDKAVKAGATNDFPLELTDD